MKVCDIIQLADILLGANIEENLFTKKEIDAELFDALKSNKRLSTLVKCANLVVNELCTEYLPIIYTQKMTPSNDCIIGYDAFDKELYQIRSIKDCQGANVKYRYLPSGIEVYSTLFPLAVDYAVVPTKCEFFDSVTLGTTQLTERIIAYGVCAEYCLLSGMYEESQIWDKRYRDSLLCVVNKKSELSIKNRRWS